MIDSRQQHGTHTWDIIIYYERCPHCGYIHENREQYEYNPSSHLYEKEFICSRCRSIFIVKKEKRPDWPTLLYD